ncbi:MAG: GNAT family N-acetyltransferase [Oscillospiraceae bacterium]|nr:GNAT family N-acetyltransferase [Oscillospiraceae bacterium]
MLNLATTAQKEEALTACRDSVIGTRIACLIEAYGFDKDYFTLWIQTYDNTVTALLSCFFGSYTLLTFDGADQAELRDFLAMNGCQSLMCSPDFCREAGIKNFTEKNAYVFCDSADENAAQDLDESQYKALYTLISERIPGSFGSSKEDYLSWLSDFTYRKKRGLSRAKGMSSDGVLFACVMTSAEAKSAAIISGVACHAHFRGGGYGGKVVLSAVSELQRENKKVYVIALNDSACGFYEHIGFRLKEKICFIEGI